MVNTKNFSRFRINPVELVIFSIVTVIGLNSVYRLFYDRQDLFEQPMANITTPTPQTGRSLASVSASFVNLDASCEPDALQMTTASKVRLNGGLCGVTEHAGSKLAKAMIVNQANQFNATVFTDAISGKFSTDYIPLNPGANPMRIEFVYQDGLTVKQNLTVTRN